VKIFPKTFERHCLFEKNQYPKLFLFFINGLFSNSLQEDFDEMVRSDMAASAGARRVGINILLASRKVKKPSGMILFLAGY